jgi:transglutaminase-like putative cysteine protease
LARTALLSLLPAALISAGWRELESPPGSLFLVSLLAIGVAVLPDRRLRLAGAVAAFLIVVQTAFGLRPVGGAVSEFANGVLDFYDVTLRFDPSEHERMHGVVLLAVFVFTLGACLAIAARRPVLAAALTFAGTAWPVTLIHDAPAASRGLFLLVAALILLAALRPGPRHTLGQTAAVGAAVVLAALVAVSTPAVAKGGFLAWERWEPYTRAEKAVGVEYVWDSNYRGINFPKQSTTVLKVKAPPRAPYWRATTLDVFVDDHWRQDVGFMAPVELDALDADALLEDPLVPPGAWNHRNWTRQEVTIQALRGRHLVAATVPVAFERGVAGTYSPGVAHASLGPGRRYAAWSYVRRPGPRDLVRAGSDYPQLITHGKAFLETPSGFVPAFGEPARERQMRELLARDQGDPRYRRLYDAALRVTGQPSNPYAAVIALEAWFRREGNFVYDETPPAWRGLPPLIAFVTRDRRGYCQHFAGAMALMLRYLGIPARVGAGFTSGRYDRERGEYTVLDTNAHTWVEVWFPEYGWLPFDPTPGRGRLLSPYTSSSTSFDASGATSALAGVGAAALGLEALRSRLEQADNPTGTRGTEGAGGSAPASRDDSGGGPSLALIVLLVAVGLVVALWLLKTIRRRARYLRRDPRGAATAMRLDLVDYLVDQQVPVSAAATPAEVGTEVERFLGIGASRFSEALGEARYGPERDAATAVSRAQRELRGIRRALRRRLSVRDRLRGLLSLRSLGVGAG